MATWTATTPYATKKQLVSSISGLYDDLQDFQFSTISAVSTLTAFDWISTPLLYVSDIKGYNAQYSTMIIASDISANAALFSTLLTTNLDFKFNPQVQISFNVKDALFGGLSGLGFLIFETLLGLGAGAGLAFKGIGEGIASMIMANGSHNTYINTNNFELKGGSTQLQISTLGNAYPAYSSIMRYVSSISPNQVPGLPIFTSTIFYPGTTCIRSISDPFSCVSQDSNIATSSIQQFGEWYPLPIEALVSSFTGLSLSNTTDSSLFDQRRIIQSLNNQPMMNSYQTATSSNDLPFPDTTPYPNIANVNKVFYHRDEYFMTNSFISSPYIRFQSTFTALPPTYFLRSTISTPAEITYSNAITEANIAICEPDETGFRSTATFDFIAQDKAIFIQWGLAVNNLNSTIAGGTAKRVSWNIPANTSNFIDIPQAQSTITNEATQQILDIKSNPYEWIFNTLGTGMNPSQIAVNVQGMTFGSNTSLSNIANYPYQFNSNLYVNGTIEAQTIIATSSIFTTSTFVDTQISTASIVADLANITELYNKEGYISTLRSSSNNPANDYITTMSRVRMAGFQTPLSIITGKGFSAPDIYNPNYSFDFTTDTSPQAVYVQSQPANKTLMYFWSTNIEIPDLTVENLTANNIVYSNADVPNLQTSTINFGWTGNFNTLPTPEFSLQQSLTTEPGLYWNTYQAASNQTLNIMAFSNTVNMVAQQFSTPLTYLNTTFDGTNRQGWASTIFYNAQTTPCRVNLGINAGAGELSLQAQTFGVIVNMNTAENVEGLPVNVPLGSTYKFTSGGSSWTTTSNAPTPGTVQYNNTFQMTMDFENLNISTTDTLNINAEKIFLNGEVILPNAQMSNLYLNTFLSTPQVNLLRTYTGALASEGTANPINITNTVNSTDFTNIYNTVNPNRGFNAFNSYNVGEWNNNSYNIDTNASSGNPTMILGEIIQKVPPFTPYAGQFFVNNTLDSPGFNIPLYVNRQGLLSTIGYATANQYARVYTNDGTNWSIQNNIANPQGNPYTYSNFITTQLTSKLTQITHGKPLVEISPTKYLQTNKIIFDCPAIRVYTVGSPSFPSKESGFEYSSYFDGNIIFTGSESDAVNPVVNSLNNYYYSVAGWSAQIWLSRIRTKSLGIQGFDVDAIVGLITGTNGDYIWFSARYLNVNQAGDSSIRENYFMTPKNYHTSFGWLGQM